MGGTPLAAGMFQLQLTPLLMRASQRVIRHPELSPGQHLHWKLQRAWWVSASGVPLPHNSSSELTQSLALRRSISLECLLTTCKTTTELTHLPQSQPHPFSGHASFLLRGQLSS